MIDVLFVAGSTDWKIGSAFSSRHDRRNSHAGWAVRGEDGAVLIVNAVLEAPDTAAFSFWPTADLNPYHFMAVSTSMSSREVGSALAMLVGYNSRTGDKDRPLSGASDAIGRLLDTDKVIAPGGLRVHDTQTKVTVQPGCCCGLEDWREWLDVTDGESLWLGHDPSPRVEHTDRLVRLWPDGADAQEATGQPIEIAVGDLPGILHSVQKELQGFLSLTRQWAMGHVPTLAEDLAAKLDEDLGISAPLPGTTGHHAP
ncbi:hypothetical protein [Streptomyces sp. NPDC058954]|uniref:hypothetical protein n=1 Tax=Streptomyces sp. NPDC058954 TaxID=3346677 RepID=UPI0036BB8413